MSIKKQIPHLFLLTRKNFASGRFKTAQGRDLGLVALWRQKQKALKNSRKKQINEKGNFLKKITVGLPGNHKKSKNLQGSDLFSFVTTASRSFLFGLQ